MAPWDPRKGSTLALSEDLHMGTPYWNMGRDQTARRGLVEEDQAYEAHGKKKDTWSERGVEGSRMNKGQVDLKV